jgi:hypothetical protein
MTIRRFMTTATTLTALATLGACGSTGETTSPSTDQTREATLMLRGVNAEDVRSAPVTIGDVTVTVDGAAVAATAAPSAIDLALGEERMAARFHIPPGADRVHVDLRFDDYGGYEMRGGRAGVLDARGTRVTLELPAAALAANGRAEIAIDLARSIVAENANGVVFAPHATTSF